MINQKYSEFLPSMQSAQELLAQVDGLAGSIDLLRAGIENEVRAGPPWGCSACLWLHPKPVAPPHQSSS